MIWYTKETAVETIDYSFVVNQPRNEVSDFACMHACIILCNWISSRLYFCHQVLKNSIRKTIFVLFLTIGPIPNFEMSPSYNPSPLFFILSTNSNLIGLIGTKLSLLTTTSICTKSYYFSCLFNFIPY